MHTITLTRPDDWHLHVRDGDALATVVPHTAQRFGRALIMPNLRPPVTTTEQALAYRDRILAAVPQGVRFEPLMSLYLTDNMPPDEIDRAKASGAIVAAKLYPAGATTNSDAGVTSVDKIYPVLERMEACGMVLCVHGEVTAGDVDVFDRERVFIERVLSPVVRRFPGLKVVFEHITTAEAAQFVRAAGAHVGATVTAHHLLLNRNAIFAGGIRPHHYCLPVLKRETHRQALVEAVASGNPRFFLGTDSAPHARSAKESACGCAGCYTAHAGIELYAEVFEAAGALDRLEAFASLNGPAFYGLKPNPERITLQRETWQVPESYGYLGADPLVPLRAGESVAWKLVP
ncbi:dihydroorotase [Parazoarcus communis]|uniref:Dihydroorotase n=1 Tax=Parazoarcus communis TaxID=41977 RepID=A0A2U8GTN5_9RHOO|nr:dihydroorotase [Parazoarcus communis]AWI76951.1 dihydroorotase [Parazoarcus communis]PKO59844.1 MAG: dihydroorotase [Betaproteobacteria bacterium HGW-Betaproteobacteria-19]|tara:strand:- start:18055 stop:19092 length:1038 start_codon:yes stop_codon:yes gene_type:complete